MTRSATTTATPSAPSALALSGPVSGDSLWRSVIALSLPVLAEQILSMFVGLNDTYLANHLPNHAADAGAAVGTITYFLWFMGLLVSSIGVGSTAIIARAKGARHKSLANKVTGQSVSASVLFGLTVGILCYCTAPWIVTTTGLHGPAAQFALSYLRLLSWTLPPYMLMFVVNSCLRGAGDTLTPAICMILVNIVNMVCSFALTRGWWGLPVMGFDGIASGTAIAFFFGGVLAFAVVLIGTRGAKLHLHRLWPHWHTIKRLLRIGIPAGLEGIISWIANYAVVVVVNEMDPTNVSASAHMNTVRLESISYLVGFAFSIAAATMVGISLGQKNQARAQKSAFMAYALGGGFMTFCGILMITLGRYPAQWLSPHDPHIVQLTTRCLFITGFIQSGFAANMIFGGALRGAGDTMWVMILNLSTQIAFRMTGVIIVGLKFHLGLPAIWCVLASELFLRGVLMFARFIHGGWKHIQV
jgi:putative MATE family efflux protein